jgi:hypothetical protein
MEAAWWLIPVIPATQEMETGRIMVLGYVGTHLESQLCERHR